MSIINTGMHFGWPSPSLPILLAENSTISMTSNEGGWLAVMPMIGGPIGNMFGAVVTDLIGRKNAVLLTVAPFLVTWLMIAFANSFTVLCSARFLAGICDGVLFTAGVMYVSEVAEPQIRGALCSCVGIAFYFGNVLVNILGSYLTVSNTALCCIIFPILQFSILIWMPDSPYYFIIRKNYGMARRALQILRGKNDVNAELERIKCAVEKEVAESGKFLDLFLAKVNRKPLLIAIGLRTFQQGTGASALMFYLQIIFIEAGSDISPHISAIIYSSLQLIVSMLSTYFYDRCGRKPFLIVSIIGAFFALATEGTYFYIKTLYDTSYVSWIPIAALMAYVIAYGIGLASVPMIMLGELFQSNIRAFALGFMDIYFSLIATVISKFFQIISDNSGMYVPFWTFASFCILGLVFVILCVPETKGKTLEEIQNDLHKVNGRTNGNIER